MAFDIKQTIKLTQHLMMTPQLQQAIKLLQLSRVELEEFVTSQLAENPILEEGINETPEERIQYEKNVERPESQIYDENMARAAEIVDSPGGDGSDFDWESYSKHKESSPPVPSSESNKGEELPNYENIISREGSINDHLLSQVSDLDMDDDEKKLIQIIIGNIDEKGYFRSSVEEIAKSENYSEDFVEDMLDVVQRLDPAGVGARDLKECLLIQLRNNKLKNGVVEKIVEHHLAELETRNLGAIAKALDISMERVLENVQIIGLLEPVPARQFGGEAPQYVIPDVYVFKVTDQWIVSLNEEGLPKLKISRIYEDMLGSLNSGKNKEKEYIREKLKSATWLIKSIQQRQQTIYRVMSKIVERQTEFFEKGVEFLRPMILKDVADDIEMSESTISRVTNNKYVHTPHGIFELKYFFNSSVSCIGGEGIASASVKKMIGDLIKAENPKRPLADQKIVDILEEKGIQLARRTVAKYREQLGILPSSKRKNPY
jgi:RNA polymerase sigma-54 factor